ncbi:MAG TPA: hypothetical protein H9820_01310 [Candidatus Companilactobacillus pullicola]|jgi:hypothetical protein|uniref:Phage protein n=1 Tax=Candidatus Companilactobacillus pullicola TaxID=2838523 RepID=A0A9D2CN30_9LACO|nr:hypothetical protein [Candidatus Companilactobacillus pullicola]
MDMTTETIEKIQELSLQAAGEKIQIVDGQNYYIDSVGDLCLMKPENLANKAISLSTLTGLVDLVKNMKERDDQKLFVRVESPTTVNVFTALDSYGRREWLAESNATTPNIQFSYFIDAEKLNIMLQSQFVQSEDRDIILKVIGNLKEENVRKASDDGVSQSVTVQSGVANVSEVKVPNPVELSPYRTFLEIEQPSSKFIFRMRKGMQGAIFGADGGAWKIDAMNLIKEYLENEFSNEIKAGHVVVVA